jgi:hypothetical protein
MFIPDFELVKCPRMRTNTISMPHLLFNFFQESASSLQPNPQEARHITEWIPALDNCSLPPVAEVFFGRREQPYQLGYVNVPLI